MCDFYKEVLKRKDEILSDITTLCQIPSILDKTTIKDNQPFGEGCRKALDQMIAFAKRDGFDFVDDEGYACAIDMGEGDEVCGVLGHVDTVPVTLESWNTDPFNPTIIDGIMYGRGVADDKGPLLAAYWGAKIIYDLKLPTSKKVRFIVGTNEETGCLCVKHYFSHHPYADFGFTPDADFPVVYGEKGICSVNIKGHIEDDKIISMKAGTRPNVVAETCVAYMQGTHDEYSDFNDYLKKYNLKGSIEEEDGKTKLILRGKSAHGAQPELGVNAIVYMCHYLKAITDNPFVEFIDRYFFEDCFGKKLHCRQDGKVGGTTINLGLLDYKESEVAFTLDIRLPYETTAQEISTILQKAVQPYPLEETDSFVDALYIDPENELIQKLNNAYVAITGDHDNPPQTMGGTTYAKEMPNCVAFGPQFVGENNMIHESNERIAVDSLMKSAAIYAKAIYDLIKA